MSDLCQGAGAAVFAENMGNGDSRSLCGPEGSDGGGREPSNGARRLLSGSSGGSATESRVVGAGANAVVLTAQDGVPGASKHGLVLVFNAAHCGTDT